MTALQFLEIFAIAIGAGVFGSMLGLGGGIILVPALVAIARVEPRVAVAASIVSVIATSSAAAIAYVRDRCADVRLGVYLETATTAGALLGAVTARHLSGETVAGLFAVLLLYSAMALLRPPRPPPARLRPEPESFRGAYFDLVEKREVSYEVHRVRLGLGASFLAGIISAILGVGGGIVKVPVMVTRMGVPLRVAVATSNFMIGVTATTTAIPYYLHGDVDPYLAAPCALGVLIGARGGARLAQKTRAKWIRAVFAAVLAYTALAMARRAGLL